MTDILSMGERERYALLSRMQADCNYYLGAGGRCNKHLWAGSPAEQIAIMEALWDSFPADGKPEWLSMEAIADYRKEMLGA